jgi:hypothetical protein
LSIRWIFVSLQLIYFSSLIEDGLNLAYALLRSSKKKVSGHITSGIYHPTNLCKIEAQLIMRFEVLIAVNVNIMVWWDMILCGLVGRYHSKGTRCLQPWRRRNGSIWSCRLPVPLTHIYLSTVLHNITAQRTVITTYHVSGFTFVCLECWWFTAEMLEDSPGCECLECGLQ